MIELEDSEVDIVIVNWISGLFLSNCLNSLHNNLIEKVSRVIVIDNNSSDASCDFLAQQFPQVKIIKNTQNLGYAGGYNQGLQSVSSNTQPAFYPWVCRHPFDT